MTTRHWDFKNMKQEEDLDSNGEPCNQDLDNSHVLTDFLEKKAQQNSNQKNERKKRFPSHLYSRPSGETPI